MTVPASTTWTLTPEQLVAACEALDIGGMPYSRFVGTDIEQPDHVRSTGKRSLVAARLARENDGEIEIESLLATSLISLMGNDHDAFCSFQPPTDARWAITVTDGIAVTIVESNGGAEIRREPVAGVVARLDAEVRQSMDAAARLLDPAAPKDGDGEPRAILETRRWRTLAAGGHIRRSDATVVARAAAAVQSVGMWEAGRITLSRPDGTGRLGGFAGEVLGWTFDERGGLVVEPDVEGVDESGEAVVVREDPDLAVTLRELWTPLLRAGSSTAVSDVLSPRV